MKHRNLLFETLRKVKGLFFIWDMDGSLHEFNVFRLFFPLTSLPLVDCMLFLNLKCIYCFYLYSKVSTNGSIFQTNFLQDSHNSLTALLIMSCHSYVTVTAPVMFCIDMSFGLNILVLICYHQLKVLL